MMRPITTYNIIPASSVVNIVLWCLALACVGLVIATLVVKPLEVVAVVVALVVSVSLIVLFASIAHQSKNARFTLSDQGLKIGPGLYGKFIPKEKIDIAGVKALNLNMDKEYVLRWRMNGSHLPGYASGWYKLKNKEKALVFLTDQSNVVYIPTTDKYSVLLSVREADMMVEEIRNWDKY